MKYIKKCIEISFKTYGIVQMNYTIVTFALFTPDIKLHIMRVLGWTPLLRKSIRQAGQLWGKWGHESKGMFHKNLLGVRLRKTSLHSFKQA